MNTIPFYVVPRLAQLSTHDRWTRAQLEKYQADSLRELRAYVYTHSPFYREFHKGLADAPLPELPVLTKAQMLEHFDDLVTHRAIRLADVRAHVAKLAGDERFLGRYWVAATSGSSGQPGPFLFNRSEWVTVICSMGRAQRWAGLKVGPPHRSKQAGVTSTTPWYMSTRVGWSVNSWWLPSLRLDATQPLEVIVEQLNAWQPEVLSCYASMARVLAEEQLSGRLHIAPKHITASSEMLSEETRRRIVAAWGRQPFDMYATTETACAAAECEAHRGMHLTEDLEIFEVVDEKNRPVPPGTLGEKLLVTVLWNRTQPLIRYVLNDCVSLSAAPCPCGRPYARMEAIQGRVEDVLCFPSASGEQVGVHPLIFDTVMDLVPATGWQVVQEADGLRVLLSGVRDESVARGVESALRQALAGCGVVVPSIKVERVETIPRGASGKAPLIKCNLARPRRT